MADISKMYAQMMASQAEMQRRQANLIRAGVVVDVDPSSQMVKVDIGDDDSPLVTPWIKWPERAGARRTWNPPSEGEEMTVFSPSGEINETSVAFPGGFTASNGAPTGNGDAAMFTLGALAVQAIAEGATVTVGGFTLKITSAGLEMTGGNIKHNGKDIGDTHKHGGVVSGPSKTQPPV